MSMQDFTGAELIEKFKAPSRPAVPEGKKRQRVTHDMKSVAYIATMKDNDEPTVRHFHQALMDLNAVHENTTPEQALNYLKSFVDKANEGVAEDSRLAMFDADGVGSVSTSTANPELAEFLNSLRA